MKFPKGNFGFNTKLVSKIEELETDTTELITSWYQENKGMIPNAPTTVGFVSTPILLHASSNLLNFSRESTWRKISKNLSE